MLPQRAASLARAFSARKSLHRLFDYICVRSNAVQTVRAKILLSNGMGKGCHTQLLSVKASPPGKEEIQHVSVTLCSMERSRTEG